MAKFWVDTIGFETQNLKSYITAASHTENKYRCWCHGFYSDWIWENESEIHNCVTWTMFTEHIKIAILCLLFSYHRKGSLHFIHPVAVGQLVSPLISFSKDYPPRPSSLFFYSTKKDIFLSHFSSLPQQNIFLFQMLSKVQNINKRFALFTCSSFTRSTICHSKYLGKPRPTTKKTLE